MNLRVNKYKLLITGGDRFIGSNLVRNYINDLKI
jgi:nucleoside-diphosphate-sugar epimerase